VVSTQSTLLACHVFVLFFFFFFFDQKVEAIFLLGRFRTPKLQKQFVSVKTFHTQQQSTAPNANPHQAASSCF
jgi:hypothetical protein